MEQTQADMAASERRLADLKQELLRLREDVARSTGSLSNGQSSEPAISGSEESSSQHQEAAVQHRIEEQAELQASQIAVLDKSKVESATKYPLRVTGTILINGFYNSGGVDRAEAPTSAFGGPGNTGLSFTQTVLGLDADGPHLWNARSRADVRVDFFGGNGSHAYGGVGGLLRLRTAHAVLNWKQTALSFALDRPLINPNAPESLLAVAQPELAWSGNLWSWNPQLGLSHTIGERRRLRLQAAVIDPADPPAAGLSGSSTQSDLPPATLAQASRRLGTEARLAFLGSNDEHGTQIGIGGYFSPHLLAAGSFGQTGISFDAWAVSLDYKVPLWHGVIWSGSAYRGQALGGLGGGGFRDFVYRTGASGLQVRGLEAIGGWSQVHQTVSERLSWNTGFGLDNAFSREVRAFPGSSAGNPYSSIARSRTVFANVIYSPRASLLLSVEYRNIYTAPAVLPLWISNTTGVGAAYRF